LIGIGIPEEDQPKLFNFYRASNTEGIGNRFGLYIVKTFIENSGIIELESQLGKGTKATLRLPKL
jgi:signal transduction histidine kinase